MDVFVSYDFYDQVKYDDICFAFDKEGIKAWKTDQITAGQSLRDKIQDAIKSCSICVFIATSKSLESGWCRAEIGAFWGARKPVVVYVAGDKPTESAVPEQFKGDKWASSIREVVSAVKLYLSEAAKNQDTDALASRRREAEAVYCLAIDSYLDMLNLQFGTTHQGFGTARPGGVGGLGQASATVRSVNAFGEMVGYDTAKSGAEADSELRSLLKRIADVRRYREKDTSETLLRLFKEVQRSAQSIAYHLTQVRLGGETLDRRWRAAQELVEGLWKERSKELSYFDSRDLDRVRRFLEDHPAYKAVYAEASAEIESFLFPGRLTLQELTELTKAELEKFLKTSIGMS